MLTYVLSSFLLFIVLGTAPYQLFEQANQPPRLTDWILIKLKLFPRLIDSNKRGLLCQILLMKGLCKILFSEMQDYRLRYG